MADTPQSLAQAAARIDQLEIDLAQANINAAQARSERNAAQAQLRAAQAQASPDPALQARIAEYERLLSPPPAGSGIVKVTYGDGRVKWAAPDGTKFTLPADAQHHADMLRWMKFGLAETDALGLLMQGVKPPT